MESFNYLCYHQEIYQQIFLSKPPLKQYAQHLVFTNEDYLEEFYFPSKKHVLLESQLRKIRENISTTYDITGLHLDVSN